MIAKYFDVSVDYLFYGKDISYNDIYEKIYNKFKYHKQMSKEAYDEVQKIFQTAHAGLAKWNIENGFNFPNHISNENGISLCYDKKYGAVISKDFFKEIDKNTIDLTKNIFKVLSNCNNNLVCLAIISMNDISINELKEKVNLSEEELKIAINELVNANIVFEQKSKHKLLGYTYKINEMYYICICIIYSTMQILYLGNKNGISCHLSFGDFPINI